MSIERNEKAEEVEKKPEPRRHEAFIARDPTELLNIREQDRSFQLDRALRSGDNFVKSSADFRSKSVSYSVEYAKFFINANLLLNGGAILALLTFLGSMFGKGDIKTLFIAAHLSSNLALAFKLYVGGLIFTVSCAALSYINWMLVAESWMNEGELMLWQSGLPPMPGTAEKAADKYIIPLMYLAIFTGIAATVLFSAGCYQVLQAFSSFDLFRWRG